MTGRAYLLQHASLATMPQGKDAANRCYLVVAYGDRNEAQRQQDRYEATNAFVKENARIFGWPETLAELATNVAHTSLLEETFEDARVVPPDALTSCRLEIELEVDAAPRATRNFIELCASHTNKQGVTFSYKETAFHRFVRGFCIQGGDVNGRGGESIYGGTFKDERGGLMLGHSFGMVSMANAGPNTNRSQFFICLSREGRNPSIDGKHVVIGRVKNADGLLFLGRLDEELGQGDGETPAQDVFVRDSGCSK